MLCILEKSDMDIEKYEKRKDSYGRQSLRRIDCTASAREPVAFDCDGVLVDTAASYDVAIPTTVETLLRMRFGRSPHTADSAGSTLLALRKTGAFNNDWDSTFAITLLYSVALTERENREWNEINIARRVDELVKQFTSRPVKDASGDVISFVRGIAGGELDVVELTDWLSYPGVPPKSVLATVFDEFYYGSSGFREFYGYRSKYYDGEGLIKKESLLFDRKLIESIELYSGRKPAIITGRPARGTRMSLGTLLDMFDLESSVFIGDLDGDSSREAHELRKPGPGALLRCMKSMNTDSITYVGNSAEDLQMAASARESGYRVWFAGIYGQGSEAMSTLDYFTEEGADMIMQDISQLPHMLQAGSSNSR